MLRDTEIREDWAAITIAVKQSQEYLRHHDGGQFVMLASYKSTPDFECENCPKFFDLQAVIYGKHLRILPRAAFNVFCEPCCPVQCHLYFIVSWVVFNSERNDDDDDCLFVCYISL